MDYIIDYQYRKDRICELLNRVGEYFKSFNPEAAANLAELSKRTAEGKFSIIVAGQFSSGKSTFLNALMGEKYLPSFTKETTATINELKSVAESPTAKPMVRVNYNDGRVIDIDDVSLDTISRYVCTDGDDVVNTISSVELFLDSKFLNDGVRLIDTPGLNGIAEGHADITKREFGQAHAAIFMFSAAVPGSKTDYNILKEMKSHGNSIIFVMNQIDLIEDRKESEHETPESVIKTIRKGFAEQFPGETLPEIWPISSYQALVARNSKPMNFHDKLYDNDDDRDTILRRSRIEDFEDRLIRYITQGERAKDELLSPVKQLESKILKCREEISSRLSLIKSDVSADELKAERERLEHEINAVKEQNKKSSITVRTEVNSLISATEDAIRNGSREIKKKYLDKLEKSEADLEEFEVNSRSFLRRMDSEYKNQIESNLLALDRNVKNLVHERFNEYIDIVNTHLSNRRSGSGLSVESVKIDSSIFDMDMDLMSEELDALYDEQFELSNKASDEDYYATIAQKNSEDLSKAKQEIKETRQYYDAQINELGYRPGAEERMRTVTKKRGGLGGFCKWIGTGSREYTDYESYLDYSLQEAYDLKLRQIRSNQDNELNEAQAKLDELRAKDTDIITHQQSAARYRAEMQAIERKIERLKSQREKNIERETRKRKRAAKDYVEECLENTDKLYMNAALSEIRNQEETISGNVNKIIDEVLSTACLDKQKMLDDVINKLNAGAEERAKEEALLTERDANLTALLGETVDLRREIEDVKTDEIEQFYTEDVEISA
jgi:GTPase SAR1 family protein